MKRLFGTDGIRCVAGRFPLDAATVRVIGAALGERLAAGSPEPLIVTGRDTRESGVWIEAELARGAAQAGARCLSAGVITTPGVAYLARSLPAHAGVVISASHNPFQDNGIKIFAPNGRKVDDATERFIESRIERKGGAASVASANLVSGAELAPDTLCARYEDFLAREIGAGLSLSGLTVALDCANGAASAIAPRLLQRLGARVVVIHAEPDGRNINFGCGSLHLEELQRCVVESGAHLGVAFDGDADRALFADSLGELVDGDATLWIMSNYLGRHGQLSDNRVVATVMSNIGLEIALRSIGVDLVRTNVGDKYVLDELVKSGASLGGEQSGHLIFPAQSLAGDGLITALNILRAVTETGQTLHDLAGGFRRYPQTLVNVRVREKLPFDQMPQVAACQREVEEALGANGRLLLRYSGTELLARVMIEGQSQTEIEALADRLAAVIENAIGE